MFENCAKPEERIFTRFPQKQNKGGNKGKYHLNMPKTKEKAFHTTFNKLWNFLPQDALYNKSTCW